MTTSKRPCGRLERWVTVVTLGVAGIAVEKELVKPKGQRTWHGLLFGWLPYDFRRPTRQRIRDTFWAPADRRLLMPRAFGLGWDVNLGRVVALVRGWRHAVGRA